MSRLLYLQPTQALAPAFLLLAPDGMRCEAIPETALAQQVPSSANILLVPGHIDQRLFASQQVWLESFLAHRGILVFNGLLAYPFLPELQPFVPLPQRGRGDLEIQIVVDHPIYQGVLDDDLTYRKGVAGFYGRGMNPPPAGAQTLVTVGQQMPLDWLWYPSTGGCVLMHAGNDIWMHSNDSNSAAKLTPQLLQWCHEEAQRHDR